MKKVFFMALLLLSVLLQIAEASLSTNIQDAPVLEWSHVPMVQVGTSGTEAHFNVLVGRNVTPKLAAYELVQGKRAGLAIWGELLGEPYTDAEGKLHEKAVKTKFSGLKPDSIYEMDVYQHIDGLGPDLLIDTRTFSTFSEVIRQLVVAVVSCMNDEIFFEKIKTSLWTSLLKMNPDLIFLIGDLTYVDSFSYVKRGTATDFDVTTRYIRAFAENPVSRARHIAKIAATIDDHDTGIDNGNTTTPTLKEAQKAFKALYGTPDVPGYIKNGPEGLYSFMTLRGINFILTDNRSFRQPFTNPTRYGYWGERQENDVIASLKASKNPSVLLDGGLITSPLVSIKKNDGSIRRVTEGFWADQPENYKAFMATVSSIKPNMIFFSGDIHSSQAVEIGPHLTGTSREFHTPSFEFTSSPGHSILFPARPGEVEIWSDSERIFGRKTYNYAITRLSVIPASSPEVKNGLDVQTSFYDQFGGLLFSVGGKVSSDFRSPLKRRQLLLPLNAKSKRVQPGQKVAFIDVQGTITPDVTAASLPQDPIVLPGVAKKIAELNSKGYIVALIDNQPLANSSIAALEEADAYYLKIIDKLIAENPKAKIHYYDFAERPEGDAYTKPEPGMALHLYRLLGRQGINIDWSQSFMVGDSVLAIGQVDAFGITGASKTSADKDFASALNMRVEEADVYFGRRPLLTLCAAPLAKITDL